MQDYGNSVARSTFQDFAVMVCCPANAVRSPNALADERAARRRPTVNDMNRLALRIAGVDLSDCRGVYRLSHFASFAGIC